MAQGFCRCSVEILGGSCLAMVLGGMVLGGDVYGEETRGLGVGFGFGFDDGESTAGRGGGLGLLMGIRAAWRSDALAREGGFAFAHCHVCDDGVVETREGGSVHWG